MSRAELAAFCPDAVLGDRLGEGGNAVVYAANSMTHGPVAVKFMLNTDRKRYARFKDEVLVVTTRLSGSQYALPILETSLPAAVSKAVIPWYVMSSAQPLRKAVAGLSWHARVEVLATLADGLTALHMQEVAHRDIKPENLFELDGTYRYGDFGIAAFPESAHLTDNNEPMGPWAYMAPEMLRTATTADPYKADVYSFAKTVWTVLTEQRVPFIGHYGPDSIIGLSTFADARDFVVEPLDTLLADSTLVDPDKRPTAEQFAARLRKVLAVQGDWSQTNKLQWEAAEVTALQATGLVRATWEGAENIAEVITLLSRRHGLNHCFYPRGGGMAVIGAKACEGGEMLALSIEYMGLTIVKPVRLTLERFPERPEFSYAVLETADTPQLGAPPRFCDSESETLKRINPFDYVLDDRDDEEPRNPDLGIPCQRFFKGGVFVIAPTTGLYNDADDYNGTATRLGRDMLRARFDDYVRNLTEKSCTKQTWKLTRQVRLMLSGKHADVTFHLNHIGLDLLERLVAIDDAIKLERAPERGRLISFSDEDAFEQLSRGPTTNEAAALDLLGQMSADQRGEYLALVELGRGHITADEVTERAAIHARTRL